LRVLKLLGTDQLCDWLKTRLDEDEWKDAEPVIRQQKIKGKNFIAITEEQWMTIGLALGVANSLVQLALEARKRKMIHLSEIEKKSKDEFFEQPLISIRADGFSENIPDFLYRDELVDKLWRFLSYSQFVVISSSPATGKTSLLKLLRRKYKFPFFYHMRVKGQDAYQQLVCSGIDLKNRV
jgi:hypothetical protein